MYYIIFGKFHYQNKPLNSMIKLSIWNKEALIGMFAQKYLCHKPKSNLHNQDVFFLEKVKVYKLETDQFESNGDVIMFDSDKIQNYKYPVTEISNISLNQYFEKIKDHTVIVQLISLD